MSEKFFRLCSFQSTLSPCRRAGRSASDSITSTPERLNWMRSTTAERSDCPTPPTLTWWGRSVLKELFCPAQFWEVHLFFLYFCSQLEMRARQEWWSLLDRSQVTDPVWPVVICYVKSHIFLWKFAFVSFAEFDFEPRSHVELGEELGLIRQRWVDFALPCAKYFSTIQI